MIDTSQRSNAPEIMDDLALEGVELQIALDKISAINRLLGGNNLTLQGIKFLLKGDKNRKITIMDVGCGSGDMLRFLADYGKENDLDFELIGIDANSYTIGYAENLSQDYSNISFSVQDIFSQSFGEMKCDILLCTLTLHHFSDAEILKIIKIFQMQASTGIVINDLHRSKLAYRLFQIIAKVFSLNEMSRNDGLVSILRGFKRHEIIRYAKSLNLKNYIVRWKWAFRYQWIIPKL